MTPDAFKLVHIKKYFYITYICYFISIHDYLSFDADSGKAVYFIYFPTSSPAKRDDEDPPIAVTPEVSQLPLAPLLDNDMQLCSTTDNAPILSSEHINTLANRGEVIYY